MAICSSQVLRKQRPPPVCGRPANPGPGARDQVRGTMITPRALATSRPDLTVANLILDYPLSPFLPSTNPPSLHNPTSLPNTSPSSKPSSFFYSVSALLDYFTMDRIKEVSQFSQSCSVFSSWDLEKGVQRVAVEVEGVGRKLC